MKRSIACFALCLPLLAGAEEKAPSQQQPETASLQAAPAPRGSWQGKGRVEYTLRHKLHTVRGVSREAEVRAVADDAGLRVMGRAPVRSFDSGNANRDAHVLETVQADRNPLVIVRALAEGFRLPAAPGKFEVLLRSEVSLAGVVSSPSIQAEMEKLASGDIRVRFAFDDRLTAHAIERPKLLLIPVDDELSVQGEVLLEAQP